MITDTHGRPFCSINCRTTFQMRPVPNCWTPITHPGAAEPSLARTFVHPLNFGHLIELNDGAYAYQPLASEELGAPDASVAESPDAPSVESPDAAFVEAPDAAFFEAPDAAFVEATDAAFVEATDAAFVEAPDVVFAEAPDVVFVEAPDEVLVEAPDEVLVEEPDAAFIEAPGGEHAKARDSEPAEIGNALVGTFDGSFAPAAVLSEAPEVELATFGMAAGEANCANITESPDPALSSVFGAMVAPGSSLLDEFGKTSSESPGPTQAALCAALAEAPQVALTTPGAADCEAPCAVYVTVPGAVFARPGASPAEGPAARVTAICAVLIDGHVIVLDASIATRGESSGVGLAVLLKDLSSPDAEFFGGYAAVNMAKKDTAMATNHENSLASEDEKEKEHSTAMTATTRDG
jgi:hypothetical protein